MVERELSLSVEASGLAMIQLPSRGVSLTTESSVLSSKEVTRGNSQLKTQKVKINITQRKQCHLTGLRIVRKLFHIQLQESLAVGQKQKEKSHAPYSSDQVHKKATHHTLKMCNNRLQMEALVNSVYQFQQRWA